MDNERFYQERSDSSMDDCNDDGEVKSTVKNRCSDSSMDDCNRWLTGERGEDHCSDSSMDDCNDDFSGQMDGVEVFRFLYGRL